MVLGKNNTCTFFRLLLDISMLLQWKKKIALFVGFITLMLTVLYCSSTDTAGLQLIINPVIALCNASTMEVKYLKGLLFEEPESAGADAREKAPSLDSSTISAGSRKENKKKQLWLRKHSLPTLSREAVDGVKKFVLFVGYPRSGHSIVGSMMDAHQNMIISHEYMLFAEWAQNPKKFTNRTHLFTELYHDSYMDTEMGWRSIASKGYTLAIESAWQGRFKQLKVIGDKSGGMTVLMYLHDPKEFSQHFRQLKAMIRVPIHVLHIVRNPYDIIATSALYRDSRGPGKLNSSKDHIYDNSDALRAKTHFLFRLAQAIEMMTKQFHLNILQLHSEDLIRDPNRSLQRICSFLEVDCLEDYLEQCSEKMYKSVSRTRDKVVWPQKILDMVESNKKRFSFFRDYTFEDDFPIQF